MKKESGHQVKADLNVDERYIEVLFNSFHDMLNNNLCTRFVFVIFLLIEFLEMTGGLLLTARRQDLQSEGNSQEFLHKYFAYFDVFSYLSSGEAYLILFVAIASITSIMFLIYLIFLYVEYILVRDKKPISMVGQFLSKSVGLFYMGLRSLLFIPFMSAFVGIMKCADHTEIVINFGGNDWFRSEVISLSEIVECGDEVYYTIIGISCILLIINAVITLLFYFFYNESQPDSTLPWGNVSRALEVCRLLKKCILVFSFIFREEGTTSAWVISLINLLNIFSVKEMINMLHMGNLLSNVFIIITESFFAWASAICFFRYFLDFKQHDIYLFFVIPFLAVIVIQLIKNRKETLVSSTKLESLENSQQAEIYIRILVTLFKKRRKGNNFLLVQSVLINHIRQCRASDCPCRTISAEMDTGTQEIAVTNSFHGTGSFSRLKSRSSWRRNSQHSNSNNWLRSTMQLTQSRSYENVTQRSFFSFLKRIVQSCIEIFGPSSNLYILLGYINYIYMKNKFIALYDLMHAQDYKPRIYQQFCMYRLKKRIEEQMMRLQKLEGGTGTGYHSLEIYKLITFHQNFTKFQENMSYSIDLYCQFWKELLEETPNYKYLNKIAYSIALESKALREQYLSLTNMNTSNTHCRMVFGLFSNRVMNDEYLACDIYDEVHITMKDFILQKKYLSEKERKYGANSPAGILLVSGNKQNIGEVLGANNELSEVLGYLKADLIHSNVSKVMPVIIGEKHNELIKRYFDKNEESTKRYIDNEGIALALHRDGSIIPVTILIKLVPNLLMGIQFIGFLLPLFDLKEFRPGEEQNVANNNTCVIITDRNWSIHGFNKTCADLFGINLENVNIRRYLNAEEKLNLAKMIPQLDDPESERAIKSLDGVTLPLHVDKLRSEIESEIDATYSQEDNLRHTQYFKELLTDDVEKKKPLNNQSLFRSIRGTVEGNLRSIEITYGKDFEHVSSLIEVIIVTISLNNKQKYHDQLSHILKKQEHLPKFNEEDMFILGDDVCSQSAASSNFSQIKIAGRQIGDFKKKLTRMKEPMFLKCLNKFGFFLFLILLGLGATELILKRLQTNFLSDTFHDIYNAFSLNQKLLSIPILTRSLQDQFHQKEANSSILIPDKANYFLDQLQKAVSELEKLFQSLEASNFPYSVEHKRIWNDHCVLISENSFNQTTREELYTINVAFNKYISKTTEITGIPHEVFADPSNYAKYNISLSNLEDAFEYLIKNGKYSLRRVWEDSTKQYLEGIEENYDNSRTLLFVISSIGAIFILLVIIIIVPYIMKVQWSILLAFNKLCELPSEDVQKLCAKAADFNKDIEAPYKKLKTIFLESDFVISYYQEEEMKQDEARIKIMNNLRKAEEKKNRPKLQDLKGLDLLEEKFKMVGEKNETKNEKSEEEQKLIEDEELDVQKEEDKRRANVKKKLFGKMTSKKRRGYILRLSVLFIFFFLFFIIGVAMLISFYSNAKSFVDILNTVTQRESAFINVILFHRENLLEQNILYEPQKGDVLEYYLDFSFEKEEEMLKLRGDLGSVFSSWNNYIDLLDSPKFCENIDNIYVPSTTSVTADQTKVSSRRLQDLYKFRNLVGESKTPVEFCKSIYDGLLSHGFNTVITQILRQIQDSYFRLQLQLNQGKKLDILTENKYVGMEVLYTYLDLVYDEILSEFIKSCEDYYNRISNLEKIRFGLFCFFLMIVFLIIWLNMLKTLRLDIFRGKGALHIFPTTFLIENKEFLKQMNKTSILD